MSTGVTEAERLSDKEHFEAVVRRYQGPLLRYVRSSLGEHDAQDVVQEAFLRLHKAMRHNGLRNIASVGAWLFRVAHNCTANVLRKKSREDKAMDVATTDAMTNGSVDCGGLDEVVHREDCRLALSMLDKLPVQQRQVLLLKIEHGMSYREISQVTSLALGTVGYLINQGLGTLARELRAAGAV